MDTITYALSKKTAAFALSGVDSMSIDNTTLNIKTKDGTVLPMVFPTPKDGVNGKDGINGKDGNNGRDGINGKDGTDGFSPTATVTKSGNISTLTVTDKNGTTSVKILDGVDGKDGANGSGSGGASGYTPTIKGSTLVFEDLIGGALNGTY